MSRTRQGTAQGVTVLLTKEVQINAHTILRENVTIALFSYLYVMCRISTHGEQTVRWNTAWVVSEKNHRLLV